MENKTIQILPEQQCTGCSACYNACPVGAIEICPDSAGFIRPVVTETCIQCGKCVQACPALNEVERAKETRCYAVWAKEEIRKTSSSGGFFTILAEHVIAQGEVVCGAAYTQDYASVQHIWVDKIEDLCRLRGSKYLQSEIGATYKETLGFLKENRKVLYSGTPCQIAGLKAYLGKEYPNLFLVDIVCHGVPSAKIYQAYIQEKAQGKRIAKMDFREKQHWGWGTAVSLFMEDGTVYRQDCFKDPYLRGFSRGLITRDSCAQCQYCNMNRVGDITLGDFWGIKEIDEQLDDRQGTSLVLVNSAKGKEWFELLQSTCVMSKEISVQELLKVADTRNGQLIRPIRKHEGREKFFKEFSETGSFQRAFNVATGKFDIGYVGWWDSKNYGSALTSFAMNRTLRNMGKTVLMLEHAGIKPTEKTEQSYGIQFARHFYHCSKITNEKDFGRFNQVCDTFVVGSDQLWNWWNNKHLGTGFFFLDFVKREHKKIAYATSFGCDWTSYPDMWRIRVGYWLSRFDAISVREKSGVNVCKDEFDVEATHVLDPVFLCDMDSYREVIALSTREEKEPYVFSYILDPTEEKLQMVKTVAKEKNLSYRIAIDGLGNDEKIKAMLQDDPNIVSNLRIEDWLYYIANASFMATDSFHGFCYSIIFRKPMIAYVNEYRGKARFDSISELLGLQERVVKNYDEIIAKDLISKEVDFESVGKILDQQIEFSKGWLKDALEARKKEPSVKELTRWKCIEHDRMLYDEVVGRYQGEIEVLKQRIEELENKKSKKKERKHYFKNAIHYYKMNGFKKTVKRILKKV